MSIQRVPRCHGPRVLTGYTLNGYEAAIVENEVLRAVVNLGRGSHIPELVYKPNDVDLLFKPPRGHRHHGSFIPSSRDDKEYYDNHAGGWFECFPTGGPPVSYGGGAMGFHGELWGTPFEIVNIEESGEACALTIGTTTHRAPFKLLKTFELRRGEAALRLREEVTNLGEEDLEVLWGQHPTLGAPFLNEHCVFECDAASYYSADDGCKTLRDWPKGPGGEDLRKVCPPSARKTKMHYLTGVKEGRARLVSPLWKIAFQMEWDVQAFPCVWFCETAGTLGAPWYGRGYFLAFEPFTGHAHAFRDGKGLRRIAAGATAKAEFTARIVDV